MLATDLAGNLVAQPIPTRRTAFDDHRRPSRSAAAASPARASNASSRSPSRTSTTSLTTATTLTLATTTPVAVEFGAGAASMLSGTGGGTTFTIADAGVYMFEFDAVYPGTGLVGRSGKRPSCRDTGQQRRLCHRPEHDRLSAGYRVAYQNGLALVIGGVVTVPSDDLVVKAVLANAYNQRQTSMQTAGS